MPIPRQGQPGLPVPATRCAPPAQLNPARHTPPVPNRPDAAGGPPRLVAAGGAAGQPLLCPAHDRHSQASRCQQPGVRRLPSLTLHATHHPCRTAPTLPAARHRNRCRWRSRPALAVPSPRQAQPGLSVPATRCASPAQLNPARHTPPVPHRPDAAGGPPWLVAAVAAGGAAGQPLLCPSHDRDSQASRCQQPGVRRLPSLTLHATHHPCRTAPTLPVGRRGSSPPSLPVVQQASPCCAQPTTGTARHPGASNQVCAACPA